MAGRPDKFTTDQVIKALQETKGLVSLAAKRLGCHPDTIRYMAKRHVTVASALKEEREAMTDVAELALFSAIQEKESWAVCFYLKTQGKNRGYVERMETVNYDVDLSTLTDEQVARLATGDPLDKVLKL